MANGQRRRRGKPPAGPSRGRRSRIPVAPPRRPTTSPVSPVRPVRPRLTPPASPTNIIPITSPPAGPTASPTPAAPRPASSLVPIRDVRGRVVPPSSPPPPAGGAPAGGAPAGGAPRGGAPRGGTLIPAPKVTHHPLPPPVPKSPLPKTPWGWAKGVGGKFIFPAYVAHSVGKRVNPAYAWLMGVPYGSKERDELLKSDVQRFGTPDQGLGGFGGRFLGTLLDPVAHASALTQGVSQIPSAVKDELFPAQYASPTQAKADKAAKKKAEAEHKKRVLSAEEKLKGAPRDLIPSKFQETKYSISPKNLEEGAAPEIVGTQRMGVASFFHGLPEVDKEKWMAQERKWAEVQGREPRSWEEVKAARSDVTDKELYWTDEERAAYAEMAENDPDKLRSWFDGKAQGSQKDNKLDSAEQRLIFDPRLGFRAQLKAQKERETATQLANAKLAATREAAAEEQAKRRWEREMYALEGEWLEEEAEREAEETRAAALKKEKRQARKNEKAAAEQLKKNRIAFAKGLESDFAHSYSPNSAFQNPETRQRLMEEAYARGEELKVSRPMVRKFLKDRGLLDKGFTESYEDFHARTTAGGGLRTGSVGDRRTVSAPKREGGGIKTQGDVALEMARQEHLRRLYNQGLRDYQLEQDTRNRPNFAQTQPRSFYGQ